MIEGVRTTLPGQWHQLSSCLYGRPADPLAVIVTADPSRWGRVVPQLVSLPYHVLVVAVSDGDPPALIDDLTRAIRFLPRCAWMAGDGMAGAALVTACGEQRVSVGTLLAVAAPDNSVIGPRLHAAVQLLDEPPRFESSIVDAMAAMSGPANRSV
jgi:hypothetical protein